MKTQRLFSYANITAITSALSAVVQDQTADAGIVFFDVDPDLNIRMHGPLIGKPSNATFGNIDLVNETYQLNANTGARFRIDSFYGFGFNGSSVNTLKNGNYMVAMNRGAEISGNRVQGGNVFGSLSAYYKAGSFTTEADGPSFFALRLDKGGGNYNYGWVQIFQLDIFHQIITGFAFEKDLNTPIFAGDTGATAVPEPGTLAVITGFFGLMAMAHLRARKQNLPSGSDALLNLAAGASGVEKFRETSAA
jgi:hypothetical protein